MTRDELILNNQKLISYTLKILGIPYDEDYFSVGEIGLINAAKSYNSAKGAFSSYAIQCIKNEIFRFKGKKQIAAISLDQPIYENITLASVIEDHYHFEQDVELKEYIRSLLECLNDRERECLIKYYGLFGQPPIKMCDLAKEYSVSHSMISYIISEAIKKIKKRGKLC